MDQVHDEGRVHPRGAVASTARDGLAHSDAKGAAAAAAAGGGFHPAYVMPRSERMALGMLCKQLIDAARCAWIQEELLPAMNQQLRGAQQHTPLLRQHAVRSRLSGGGVSDESDVLTVSRVCYMDQSVTGENTLLLVGRPHE
jgi:hypothetical protein